MAEKKRTSGMPTPPFPAEEMPRSMGIASAPEKEERPAPRAAAKPTPAPPPAPTRTPEAPAPAPPKPEPSAPASAVPAPTPAGPAAEAVTPASVGTSPPLFVKVDKYQNIVNNIQKLKSYSLGLRDALDALADIEKELQHGLSVLNRALDNFNSIIGLLDAKLLRIQGIEKTVVETPKEMDEYVKGVYDQMEKIKHDLRSIS